MKRQVFNGPVVITAGDIQITCLGHTTMQVEHEYEPGRTTYYGSNTVREPDYVSSSTITLTVHPKMGEQFLYEVKKTDGPSKQPTGQRNDHADPERRLQGAASKDQGTSPDGRLFRTGQRVDPQWYRKAAIDR